MICLQRHRLPRWFAASAGTAALALLAIAGASPAHGHGPEPEQMTVGEYGEVYLSSGEVFLPTDVTIPLHGHAVTPAQVADFQLAAEEVGISLAEAIDRYAWQEDFVEAAMRLEEDFPDEYAGSAIVGDGAGGWIAFKGDIPDAAFSLAGGLPKPVGLVAGRGFSQSELVDTLQDTYYRLYEHPDIVDGRGSVDMETGKVEIILQARPGLTAGQHQLLEAELTQERSPN